jgi:hypothetical protein
MRKTRIISAAVASLAIGSVAAGLSARADTFGRDHERDEVRQQAREVRLDLPRNAAGAIDVDRLAAEIRAALDAGARDIRLRGTVMSAADVQALRQVAARFDFERVRIREENNRVRVDLRRDDRDEFRRRIEVRRNDGDRNEVRKRIEIRDRDDDRDRREIRVERRDDADRPERIEKVARVERPEKAERVEKVERIERPEKTERVERAERPERMERAERPERDEHGGDRPDRSGRH